MTIICLIIKGARRSLTPKPQRAIKGSQGMEVKPWSLISQAAVNVNTGVKKDQIKGIANTLGGLYCKFSAAACTA